MLKAIKNQTLHIPSYLLLKRSQHKTNEHYFPDKIQYDCKDRAILIQYIHKLIKDLNYNMVLDIEDKLMPRLFFTDRSGMELLLGSSDYS